MKIIKTRANGSCDRKVGDRMRFARKCLNSFFFQFPVGDFRFLLSFRIPFICCFNGRSVLANRAPIGRSPRALIGRESFSRNFYFSLDDLTKHGKTFDGDSRSNSPLSFWLPFFGFFSAFSCMNSNKFYLFHYFPFLFILLQVLEKFGH